MAIRDRPELE